MLQIKEFAKLCGCTTSLLRYYDNKDVLKPYFIESFTGYRYYQSSQALEFHRIKELQKAGFSIKEIKKIKDKNKNEIIDILKDKLIKQKQLTNSIENLIKTYQDNEMKIENNVKESDKLYSMKVTSCNNKLILNKKNENIILNFNKDTTEISILLNNMQKQVLIGFEDLDDLKEHQNKTWYHTKIISGWQTKEELLKKIKNTKITKELCVHLFNINESINLFTIAEIMTSVDSKGYLADNSLFNVSLSTEHTNSYTIIYINK